jgi:epoxide hydrolase 4
MDNIAHKTIIANSMHFHLVEAGMGLPVLFLHGFPEFWYSWRHQILGLSQAGFRTIAPDLRGYNLSDRPAGVAKYRTKTLVADIAAIIGELNLGRVHVVGHDWGGLLAWRLAALHPELVDKLVVMNAAHPMAYRRELRRNPLQWLRSYYVLLFQLPWLPERLISANDFASIERAWRRQPVNPGAFSDDDIAQYKQALGTSGVTAPINYYRAAFRYSADLFGPPQRITAPTTIIWGQRDPFMTSAVNERLGEWVPNLTVHYLPDASHWVQNDAPEAVNRLLIEFLSPAA